MTETTQHPVDLALRTLTTKLDPSRADFDYARVKLLDAISAATPHQPRTRSHRSWAIGLVVVVVIAVFLVQTVSTSPAEALITELARVVEASDPMVIPDGQFAYTQTDATGLASVSADAMGDVQIPHSELAYLLPTTRETWIGEEGTVRLSETTLVPEFFSAVEEAAYYVAEVDKRDRIGKTQIRNQTDVNQILTEMDWPTDPGELEATIRSVSGDTDQAVLDTCIGMLRATLISRELRTAVLRVIAGLDLELVEDGPSGSTFSVSFDTPLPMRWSFTLDDGGYLRFEERVQTEGNPDLGVPPGTVEYTATYSVPVLVDSSELP